MALFWNGFFREMSRRVGSVSASAVLLLFLACGVLWGIWRMDLTYSDTSSFFRTATEWTRHGASTRPQAMAYSPLYCAFLTLCQRAFSDAGDALVVHRMAIVLLAALAILLSLRRILPRAWAWLVAAWWVVLPNDWGALFEVHLFGFALTMAACAFAGGLRSAWGRGIALAILLATALLVRNEFFLSLLLFAVCCAVDFWRRGRHRGAIRETLALTAPSLAAGLLLFWLLSGNLEQIRWTELRKAFEGRTSRNLSQVYAFSYKQRRSDWQGDPWHDGRDLLQRDFGRRDPNFSDAFRANPRAMIEHFAWNFRLLPAGLQYALLNGYTGRIPPDFADDRPKGMPHAILGTALIAIAWVGGAALLIRWRRRFGRFFLSGSPAFWTWTFLLCCVPPCLIAVATNRPRPSYIFPLSLLLMAFTGLSVRLMAGALRRRFRLAPALTTWIPAVCGAILLVIFPGSNWPVRPQQPLLIDYRRLKPFQKRLMVGRRTLCAVSNMPSDLANYLSPAGGEQKCGICDWESVAAELQRGAVLGEVLDRAEVTDFYVQGDAISLPQFEQWRASASASGWQPMAAIRNGAASWELWSREDAVASLPARDPAPMRKQD